MTQKASFQAWNKDVLIGYILELQRSLHEERMMVKRLLQGKESEVDVPSADVNYLLSLWKDEDGRDMQELIEYADKEVAIANGSAWITENEKIPTKSAVVYEVKGIVWEVNG